MYAANRANPPVRKKDSVITYNDILPNYLTEFYDFGTDTTRFSNLAHISAQYVVFAGGNAFHAFNVATSQFVVVPSLTLGGVTTVAATADRQYLAIAYASAATGAEVHIYKVQPGTPEDAEQPAGEQDNVIIVDDTLWLQPQAVLRGVGALGVETMAFNADGTLLATVSSDPDFVLSVWAWARPENQLLLSAPAFSSVVMRVAFCRYTADALITGGRAHIKFWKMAQTFTGPKLKGDLAKFGVLDASDATGFLELPSGNFLHGCGTGELAFWDHTTVRMVFVRPGGRKCHAGAIEFLYMDLEGLFTRSAAAGSPAEVLREELERRGVPTVADAWVGTEEFEARPGPLLPVLLTAGADGYICLWSGHQILQAQYEETMDGGLYYELTPVEEIFVGPGSCIRNMSLSPDRQAFVMQDAGRGGLVELAIATRAVRRLTCGHGGAVRSIALCNSDTSLIPGGVNDYMNKALARSGLVATLGSSGTLFLHDLIGRQLVGARQATTGAGTKVVFIHNGLCLVSGYTDGTVRFHAVAHGYLDAVSDPASDPAGSAVSSAADDTTGECLNLLCAYRCFPDAVVDITCNAHGVVAVLSATGTVFLIQVGLSLVRRERAEDLAGAGESVRLNALASGLLNVRNDEALSAAERHSLGLAQRNQRGHLGVTLRDVVPLGYFDAFARIFGESPDKTPRTLRNMFFVDPTTLCFTVCNAQAAADRLAALATPSLQDLLNRRAPDIAAEDVAGVIDVSAGAGMHTDTAADAGSPARQSTVSYAIDDLLPAPPVFVGVAIPATPLPGTTEATMGRIERHVTQRRIAALMPSKGVMDDALNALLLLEAADAEVQKERAGGPGPDGGADGDADAAPRAPRRTDQSDPLLEDASAPQEFDFVQVSLASAGGFTTTTADEDAHLVVVVRCFVDRDVRNRAESAMASVRARAEAAASGAAAGATNAQAGDPAFLQAALAVAELRAAYRSSLVYTFSLAALRKAIRGLAAWRAQAQGQDQGPPGGPGGAEGPGAAPFLHPCVVAPAGQTSRIIDAALLSQEQLANPEFAPDASETPRVLLRQPLLSFPLAARRLQDLVVDADAQRAVADAADTGACMAGNLFTALNGGALCVQPFEAPEEFCALRTDSLVLNRWWTSNHAQAVPGFGIAAMEAGLGGHVLVCGDEAGRVLAFCTKEFAALLESAARKQQAARLPRRCGLHAEYVRDNCWSTGTDMIRPPETVLFTDEVYGLVPSQLITAEVAEAMDKQPNLVPLDSLDLQPRPDAELPTIEEARLLDIDSTASKHGRDLKATVLTKVDALRTRFAALVRENAALPADKRLLPHQLCPDLLLANAWLSREEARAHEVICSELGGVLMETVRRIAALLRAFPVADLAHTVRAFSNPAQRVQSFQVLPLPPGFEEELCRVLGVESAEELARMMETRPAPAPALSERGAGGAGGAGDAGLSETGTLQPSDDESMVTASLASTLRTAEPDDGGLAESRGPPQPLGNSILTRTKGGAAAGAKAPGGTRSLRSVDKVIAATLHGRTAGDQDATSDQDNIKARVAQRMAARAQRRAELKRLMAQKPDPEGISPEDEQSLQAAADTVGLFPLKTTEEYVAKLGQLSALQAQDQAQGWGAADGSLLGMRDTRDGKWTEFLLTLKGMHDAKQEFNERVAVLLACKQAVVAAVRQRRARAVHVAAAVRRLAGPALAAELDSQLLQDLAIPDPDKLSAFVRFHPDERGYLKQLAALRRFAAGFDERLVAGRLEPTALCTRLAACFLADDRTHDDLLADYIDACVADRLILPEEAARLRGLVDAPGRACASIVEDVVFATSALLGGKSFGAARRRARGRGAGGANDASDNDGDGDGNGNGNGNGDENESDSEDDRNDDDSAGRADEDPNAQLLGDTRYTADVILGVGRAYGRSASFAATLQAQRDYDARALLAPHANPNVNVVPATDGYDASKPLNAFCGAGTSGLYAARAGDWLGILLLCRHRLSAEIAAVTAAFDASVRALQHAGLQLQTDFCRMRVRLVTLFQEAEIHHLYVTRDARCVDALEGRRAEQQAISAQLGALCKQIVARTREAQGVCATLQRLLSDVQAAIPLDAPYRGKLLRLYTRRCKAPRTQKRPASGAPGGAPGGGPGDAPGGGPADPAEHGRRGVGSTNPDDYLEESEESSALSDISDGGAGGPGDADEPVDESAPPEGCSRELFEAVLRLRVQKRDADAALAAVHAGADQLRQQYVSLQKRERQTLQAIDQARRELTLFRAGKQRELNQVGTAALVTMGQYALLSDTGRLNPDLSGALLLDLATLQGLRGRIGRRGRELQDLRALGLGLRAEHKQLTAQEGVAQAELRRLVEKAEAVQQLKFGRLIDISRLDRVAVNEPAVAVEEERAREEARHWQRREAQTRALDEGRDGLRATLDHNTALVRRLCALERESTQLDSSIQARQRRAPKAWCSDNKQELVRQEYNSLKQTIVDRERELRTLVDEIAILKNHGNQ